jgi:hypothetical protein
MLTARGKEYENRVTAPSKNLGAMRSYATVAPSLRAEPVATVGRSLLDSKPDWLATCPKVGLPERTHPRVSGSSVSL